MLAGLFREHGNPQREDVTFVEDDTPGRAIPEALPSNIVVADVRLFNRTSYSRQNSLLRRFFGTHTGDIEDTHRFLAKFSSSPPPALRRHHIVITYICSRGFDSLA